MESVKKDTWVTFKDVAQKFPGNYKDPSYITIVDKMLQSFQKLGCNINLENLFLHSNLENFPENLDEMNEEQDETFHQDIKCLGKCYQQGCYGSRIQ